MNKILLWAEGYAKGFLISVGIGVLLAAGIILIEKIPYSEKIAAYIMIAIMIIFAAALLILFSTGILATIVWAMAGLINLTQRKVNNGRRNMERKKANILIRHD